MTILSRVNVGLVISEDFAAGFSSDQEALDWATNKVQPAIAGLNNAFIYTGLEFGLIFIPENFIVPNQGVFDNSGYNMFIRNLFDQQYPCLDLDVLIVAVPGTGHGYGGTRVARISKGALTRASKTAHEVGHVLGLAHADSFCYYICENPTTSTFMCDSGIGSIKLNPCDVSRFSDYVFTSDHCSKWQDVIYGTPGNFTCPDEPSITIDTDQKYLTKECSGGRDKPMYTITVIGGENGTNGLKVRAKYLRAAYDINLGTQGMDFNNEDTSDPNYNYLRIFENGVEKEFNLGPYEQLTVHFQLTYNPDPGYSPNDLNVRVFGELIHPGGIYSSTPGQKVYKVIPSGSYGPAGNGLVHLGSPVIFGGDITFGDVNNELTLNYPSILVTSGSQVNIKANSIVNFPAGAYTVIEGCDEMWKGIKLNQTSTLKAQNITIKDAQNAVAVSKGANLEIESGRLVDNNFGIITLNSGAGDYDISITDSWFESSGNPFRSPYAGQYPLPDGKGYVGISIENLTNGGLIFEGTNIFKDLKYGILAKQSILNVKNTLFEDITNVSVGPGYTGPLPSGKAIYCEGGSVFMNGNAVMNCHTGAEILNATNSIVDCKFLDVNRGIIVTGGQTNGFNIADNDIEASLQGISVLAQSGLPSNATVSGNKVTIESSSLSGMGIRLGLNGLNSLTEAYVVDNEIIMDGGATGILVNDTRNTHITSNDIQFNNANKNRWGIRVSGGDDNLINCNNILGDGLLGMYGLMASRTDFVCNTTDGQDFGISLNGVFTGATPSIKLGDNKMRNNGTVGLRLGTNALIGNQVHQGNRWSNGGGATVAEHLGGAILAGQSEFIVDVNENVEYLPGFVNPFGWFIDIQSPSLSYICNPLYACPIPSSPTPGELDRKTAKGELSGFEDQNHSLWMAQKRLFHHLTYENNPYTGVTEVDSFLLNNQNTTVGKYADVAEDILDLHVISASDLNLLDSLETDLATLVEDLADVETALSTEGLSTLDSAALAATRDSLRNVLSKTFDDITAARQTIQTNRNSNASSVISSNSYLSGSNSYEANEKSVNAIYLQTIAQGILSLTTQQETDLTAIAGMCPVADGEAVLRAREILDLVGGSYTVYDDEMICSAQPRDHKTDQVQFSNNIIRIYPNPADQQLRVDYELKEEAPASFILYNSIGGLVLSRELTESAGTILINTANLPSGSYFYRAGNTTSGKVSIQH